MTHRSRARLTAAAALATGSVLLGGLATPAAAAPRDDVARRAAAAYAGGHVLLAQERLRDLQPDTANPTDGATAFVAAARIGGRTHALLWLTGLDEDAAGRTFGVHVHVGPCVPGNGDAAGPHFNIDAYRGDPTPTVSPQTEIWLDTTVAADGTGLSWTSVPFEVPPGGAQSIVVHEHATEPDGDAGARIACIPVRS